VHTFYKLVTIWYTNLSNYSWGMHKRIGDLEQIGVWFESSEYLIDWYAAFAFSGRVKPVWQHRFETRCFHCYQTQHFSKTGLRFRYFGAFNARSSFLNFSYKLIAWCCLNISAHQQYILSMESTKANAHSTRSKEFITKSLLAGGNKIICLKIKMSVLNLC
jgi:hypothetical protein